ncbi:MAG: 2,3-bisphosphoglycerate-independent phosphoglycerate mutase [Deltaproteobacteria bacterium]|nr:2,3-bisphosphoglycerate-independent phosphoglycerate mutase [Deltaproteobacteria bacterium]MBW2020096.1 2,3-bisphosphoglycerate-independent phosphoglycerate mutase [Deltaproteobacteria bacterium]MBW2074837.1 2,3-bisphosphoglycerate-independent phosphoglycerate mutase [Deltaproteobacteria bacterium]RLB82029.1 MAG: 2,3-bisphosphoglycerate-independent phosphoglycerate mutase [Deltaproteobacteria bacterium]
MKPVALIVRDGWGYRQEHEGNAVKAARTPNVDSYLANYPWVLLHASGEPVGLPHGYQGSSEVGHLNMGAGRIVIQELKRINDGMEDGTFFKAEDFKVLVQNCRTNNSRLHLMGLLQDEGVHAHCNQMFKIMHAAREQGVEEIIVHIFTDGRDTPPRSALQYIDQLNEVMNEMGNCRVGTLMGRYYSMDRSRNWDLTSTAFECIVNATARKAESAKAAVEASYAKDKTPDGIEMFDEYIPPHVIGDYDGVRDGDSVLHTNFRQDRAIQLSMAFVEDDYPGRRSRRPDCLYVGLTRYYNEFPRFILGAIDSGGGMKNLLGEIVSNKGLKQLRLAETQKFRHVTSFFNGKSTKPYSGEDQVEIKSQYDPATFASHPEMNAHDVRDKFLEIVKGGCEYAFILINFANCDMVGHTGDMAAATKAVEVVDECVGDCIKRLLELEAEILLTADHGNAEEMIDPQTKRVKTSHTLNPVELIYISREAKGKKLKSGGKLADIAPTILKLMNIDIPPEMTATQLIEE